jgi:hypothetical protein
MIQGKSLTEDAYAFLAGSAFLFGWQATLSL